MRTTILQAQQGIKTIIIEDDSIAVHYVDGAEPIFIYPEDAMYDHWRTQFLDCSQIMVTSQIKAAEERDEEAAALAVKLKLEEGIKVTEAIQD